MLLIDENMNIQHLMIAQKDSLKF